MTNNRRDFLRNSAAMAALSVAGIGTSVSAYGTKKTNRTKKNDAVKDAGVHLCEAYFDGPEARKVALNKQLGVLGAVGRMDPKAFGSDRKPWEYEGIVAVKDGWDKLGLKFRVIEGDYVMSEKLKLGLAGRDEEIEHFIQLIRNIGKAGIEIICYNWMPVSCCERYEKTTRGGALTTAFDYEKIKDLPLTQYGKTTAEGQWKNLEYFLKAVIPEAEKAGVKMALHPDDPQVESIAGITRIMGTVSAFDKMLKIYPSPNNGVTLCQANFSLMGEDIPKLAHHFKEKIHFVHFRNILGGKYKFEETFHDEGQIDMLAAMQAYYDIGFRGPIRPDHVPTMEGDTNERPGYSKLGALFAFGYMKGLMASVSKG